MPTDTERLDWVGGHYARFKCGSWTGDRAVGDVDVTVAWCWFGRRGDVDCETTARPDFRAAIDRAMQESKYTLPPLSAVSEAEALDWLWAAVSEDLITEDECEAHTQELREHFAKRFPESPS